MPLSPSATRELLAKLGHHPKRFLGQNFLVDGNIVRKSLELARIAPGDIVVEIGPGLGTLTSALLRAGATVWAVEKDRALHAHLAATLAREFPETFHLLEGDAVEHPIAGLPSGEVTSDKYQVASEASGTAAPHSAARTPPPAFKIVANLPYAISTPWMDAILGGPLPARMVLMLQQEAAQRYAATPGSKQFSAISIFLQNAYDLAPGHKVAAACFHPRPEVESCLLHLVRKSEPFVFSPQAKAAIRACFQQRRKQLGALLRNRLPDHGRAWLDTLAAHGHDARSRPEQIPPALWTALGR
ncbi:16S rRNA (adenine(1518)-N(6)/adenine(1519)-N(6))-dimethyltransferase RsmA [Termitidicoccus mucosus]|uniref:Ribosomal RNA small subunit methyltransferase A n=1 Tax=Termitidicoccus mucosus TaxID=1184151 RepID=A0A178INU6_9BACT|nr:16S rRNA methyltransferase [Opitutaceae bacterium TSB47]